MYAKKTRATSVYSSLYPSFCSVLFFDSFLHPWVYSICTSPFHTHHQHLHTYILLILQLQYKGGGYIFTVWKMPTILQPEHTPVWMKEVNNASQWPILKHVYNIYLQIWCALGIRFFPGFYWNRKRKSIDVVLNFLLNWFSVLAFCY